MPTKFRQRLGEISIQLEFDQPTFSLFSNMLGLGRALFSGLAPLGMKLADLKFAGGETTYADTHVTGFLYGFSAELNVRPERIEIRSFDPAKRREAFEALDAASAAALEFMDDAKPKSCTSVTALHGELGDVATRDFVGRYVTGTPTQLGAPFSSGVVFYFKPDDGRLMASVNLEPSVSIQGGLYCRTTNIWNMSNGGLRDIAEREEGCVAKTFAVLDLEPT